MPESPPTNTPSIAYPSPPEASQLALTSPASSVSPQMPPDTPAVAPSAIPPQLAIEKHTSHLQLDYYYNRTVTKSPLKRTGWRSHASVASASKAEEARNPHPLYKQFDTLHRISYSSYTTPILGILF